jgi:putative (di)nucleoside polyphosphate hydrolase
MAKGQSFRANVGVVVLNGQWQVLALDRIDKEALKEGIKKGKGQWQMPQGGLDDGEEPDMAWQRELYEEIGVKAEDVELLSRYPDWLVYELPKKDRDDPNVKAKQGRGQVQQWFFVRLKPGKQLRVDTDDLNEQEFAAYKWLPLGQLAEETWEIRRPLYFKLAMHLHKLRKQVPTTA